MGTSATRRWNAITQRSGDEWLEPQSMTNEDPHVSR